MVKLILSAFILCSHLAFAQDLSRDLEFMETQNTLSSATTIPLYVDPDGNVSLISKNSDANVSFTALGHFAYRKSMSNYISPIQRSEFGFLEQKTDMGWIEVKRKRWELGLGIGASFAKYFGVGLSPYKGARQVMIRQKKTRDEVTPKPKLPDDLEETKSWSVGDRGSFQRYGGIQFYGGASFMSFSILSAGWVIQNLFNVVVKKISDKKIHLSIAEERVNKRRLQTGTSIANAKIHFFNGKKLSAEFTLDLENPDHHELYRLAFKGKLDVLQGKLPQESQKLSWKGSEKMGYIGIPSVIGQHKLRSEYEMDFDGEQDVLDIKSVRNSGTLLPLRNHNRLVYQTDNALILFWYSEMNKADEDVLSRRFLMPGKIMGAKGFDSVIPEGTKIGATLSQMGMSFTREELEAVTPELLEEILENFKLRCETMALSCAKEKRFDKIADTLRGYINKQTWEDVRDKLGFLMIDEPALIHSYIKAIKSKKRLYFKFLNEKFQSMEGAAAIEV